MLWLLQVFWMPALHAMWDALLHCFSAILHARTPGEWQQHLDVTGDGGE
jgi:hypothetical protein